MSANDQVTVLIRNEDAEHPKLNRLRRVLTVETGGPDDVHLPWIVWATGLSRKWLMEKLDAGGQVLVMPPWPGGGFAGLPPARMVDAPDSELTFEDQSFAVSASNAIEPSSAWVAHGLFQNSNLAWLVSYEPFAGAGQAWMASAELLVTSPSTRPRDAKRLITTVAKFLTSHCASNPEQKPDADVSVNGTSEFTAADVPYLLAANVIDSQAEMEAVAQFVNRRLAVEPDMNEIKRIINHPLVADELSQPSGSRRNIARVIDELGFRSFRLEIEETVS